MKEKKNFDAHSCSVIEKKRLDLDLAYCDVTYDSQEAIGNCYASAKDASIERERACNNS